MDQNNIEIVPPDQQIQDQNANEAEALNDDPLGDLV
jgi:hypothetical protein